MLMIQKNEVNLTMTVFGIGLITYAINRGRRCQPENFLNSFYTQVHEDHHLEVFYLLINNHLSGSALALPRPKSSPSRRFNSAKTSSSRTTINS